MVNYLDTNEEIMRRLIQNQKINTIIDQAYELSIYNLNNKVKLEGPFTFVITPNIKKLNLPFSLPRKLLELIKVFEGDNVTFTYEDSVFGEIHIIVSWNKRLQKITEDIGEPLLAKEIDDGGLPIVFPSMINALEGDWGLFQDNYSGMPNAILKFVSDTSPLQLLRPGLINMMEYKKIIPIDCQTYSNKIKPVNISLDTLRMLLTNERTDKIVAYSEIFHQIEKDSLLTKDLTSHKINLGSLGHLSTLGKNVIFNFWSILKTSYSVIVIWPPETNHFAYHSFTFWLQNILLYLENKINVKHFTLSPNYFERLNTYTTQLSIPKVIIE